MQDTNPLKSAALKEALQRYENNLQKENKHEGGHLKDHKHKIDFDENQLNQEKETKINKQTKFRQEIQEQMELNVSNFFDFTFVIILGPTKRRAKDDLEAAHQHRFYP